MVKVFLVDDEIVIREGIRNSFPWEESGYTLVGEAPDGEIALPMIRDANPDILITDIRMPFMDGMQLCREVKRQMPWIGVVILSGYDDFTYARQAISLGVKEYLLKPVTAQELKEVLDRKEYVCFQGDRFVEGSPTVTLPFMRHEAPFPAGPFAVAGKFRAPVVFYYAMRERGRRYRFIFDIPDEDGCGTKEAILGSYVRSLEAVVRRYPQQWFNFYRFWS